MVWRSVPGDSHQAAQVVVMLPEFGLIRLTLRLRAAPPLNEGPGISSTAGRCINAKKAVSSPLARSGDVDRAFQQS